MDSLHDLPDLQAPSLAHRTVAQGGMFPRLSVSFLLVGNLNALSPKHIAIHSLSKPFKMPSSSPERGRTRSRQQSSAYAKAQSPSRTRSPPRHSASRSASRSRSPTRSISRPGRKSNALRSRSRSPTRSRSPAGRAYRDRSLTRSPSRSSPMPKSSKVCAHPPFTPHSDIDLDPDRSREAHQKRQRRPPPRNLRSLRPYQGARSPHKQTMYASPLLTPALHPN